MSATTFISAATFLEIVDQFAESGYLSNNEVEPIVEVVGVVDLVGRKFPSGFLVERVCFRHAVRMNNCGFSRRVHFKGCAFHDHLDLGNAEFSDGIAFDDCRFEVQDAELARQALSLDDARIIGNVSLFSTTAHGCISAKRLSLAGDFTFTSCTIEGNSSNGVAVVDFSDSEIVGTVGFEFYAAREFPTPSEAVNAANRINQTGKVTLLQRSVFIDRNDTMSVTLRNSKVTDVSLACAHFRGDVNLHAIECVGLTSDCNYFSSRPGDAESWPGESFGGAKIEGKLTLSAGTFGFIRLSGILIKGFVMLIDGRSGQIEIGDGVCRQDRIRNGLTFEEIHIAESEIYNLAMVTWNCRDRVNIHVKRVTGEPNKWGIQGVSIRKSEIHGDLSFWPGKETARLLQQFLDVAQTSPSAVFALDEQGKLVRAPPRFLNWWRRRLRVSGVLEIDSCTVKGDIVLTGVNVEDFEDGRPGGRISICNSEVAGEVKFMSPISCLNENGPDRLLLLLARWFIARELAYQFLLRKILELEILASEIALLAMASPALAQEILGRKALSDEIANVSATNPDRVRAVLLNTEISRDELANLLAGLFGEELDRVRAEIADLPIEGLEILRGRAASEIVGRATAGCETLPSEIVELARQQLDDFRAEHAFEQASCTRVDMNHLSTAKLDLAGLRIRKPGPDGEVRERRVNLHYAKVSERLDTLVRLKEVDEVWKQLNQILLPPASDRAIRSAAPVFAKGRSRERDVLSYCFGEEEIKFLESIPERHVKSQRVELSADIPGALDMLHAEIDELYLSDKPFRDADPRKKSSDQGVVLDYAKVSKLYVARGLPHEKSDLNHNGFPVPLSLLNLSVRAWFLEGPNEPKFPDVYTENEATTADSFLDLLDNDRVFRASAYLEIEKLLRNRGLEEQANRVFIAGHYRDVRIGFEDEEYSDNNVKRESRFGKVSRWWRIWRPGDGRYRPRILFPVFRLRHPRREYLGSVICIALISALAYLVYMAATAALANDLGKIETLLAYAIPLAFVFYVMRHAMRLFRSQLFWSILNYGTSPWRPFIIIVVLAGFSFVFISGERENFEPTLAAEIADTQKRMLASGKGNSTESAQHQDRERKWDEGKVPKKEYWPLGERAWITLRYHVPLVSAVLSEEWQPADRPLAVSAFESTPSWWPFDLRSRDWFGFMLWTNWLLWPLFLPYLIRRLIRNDE